jgi:hypothetical protein
MKQKDKQTSESRRAFLRGTVATGAGAAVAATVPGVAVAATSDTSPEPDTKQKGYRLTQHILDYYKTAAS